MSLRSLRATTIASSKLSWSEPLINLIRGVSHEEKKAYPMRKDERLSYAASKHRESCKHKLDT